jgi:hypothetical protein
MALRFDSRLVAIVLASVALNITGIVALRHAFEGSNRSISIGSTVAHFDETILPEQPRLEPSMRAYPETMARPLFMRSRAPFVPPPPAESVPFMPALPAQPPIVPPQPVVDGDVRVFGVLADGRAARALLTSNSKPDGDWLRVGEAIGGWTLVEITSEGVVLSAGPQQRTLRLYQ